VSLAPLFKAGPAIQLHAFAALAAFGLGAAQLAAPKGTLPHRAVGWAWVTIHELRLWGPWSPIHLLAIYTLAMLPLAAMHARRHRVEKHRKANDRHLCRRACRRRPIHVLARPHHACGVVRAIKNRAKSGAKRGAPGRSARPSQLDGKSLNLHMKIALARARFWVARSG